MQGFYERVTSIDFVVGLLGNSIFWLLDIVLIVILLPTVIKFLEHRKWSNARHTASLLVAGLLRQSVDKIAIYLKTLSDFDPDLYGDAQDRNRALIRELRDHIERVSLEFYNQFPIVSNSVNPDMSIQIAAIIKYSERLAYYGMEFAELTNRIHAKGTFVGVQRAASAYMGDFLGEAGSDSKIEAIQGHIVKLFDKAHKDEALRFAHAIRDDIQTIVSASSDISASVAEADKRKGTRTTAAP